MTNQLASLARRDYFYLDAFWRVNLGMCIIIAHIQHFNYGISNLSLGHSINHTNVP